MMTDEESLSTSPKDYISQFQHRRPSVEESLSSLSEPSSLRSSLSSLSSRSSTPSTLRLLVVRIISHNRFLLVPFTAYALCNVRRALLTEATVNEMEKQFPGVASSLKIGSVVEGGVEKTSQPLHTISHFVKRVEKVWVDSLVPLHSLGNVVQMRVEVDLSMGGRCRREYEGDHEFFVLMSRHGVEVSISTRRLRDYLEDGMKMEEGTILECTTILMEGAPTPFRILDTCNIIKKTPGKSAVTIPTRATKHVYEKEATED